VNPAKTTNRSGSAARHAMHLYIWIAGHGFTLFVDFNTLHTHQTADEYLKQQRAIHNALIIYSWNTQHDTTHRKFDTWMTWPDLGCDVPPFWGQQRAYIFRSNSWSKLANPKKGNSSTYSLAKYTGTTSLWVLSTFWWQNSIGNVSATKVMAIFFLTES